MDTREHAYRRRFEELPPGIIEAARHNPVVHRLAEEYAIGRICFMEEVLAQMVIALAKDWQTEQRRAYEAMLLTEQAKHVIADEVLGRYAKATT